MEPRPPMPPPPSEPAPAAAPRSSLAARLLNVFATPGEVFEEVKTSPPTASNWLVPALIGAAIGILMSIVMFSQPAIVQQIHEQQAQAMDQMVKNGKMSQADADRGLEMAEKFTGPTMLKIFGSAGAVVGSFVRIFWWALVLWLLSMSLLKVRVGYLKAAEVAGLATMISALGALVTLLLIVNFGKMFATPSLALTVSDFNLKNKSHVMLGAANVFSFWFIGVVSAGLARLAGVPFARALLVILPYWILQELFLIFSGMGQMAL